MDASYYEMEEKKQRRVVVAVITLIAVVVLAITAWAIVSIVSGSETAQVAESSEVTVDDPTAEAPKSEGVTSESNSTEKSSNSAEGSTEVSKAGSSKSGDASLSTVSTVPETGPEDLLPLALLAGAGAAFIASRKLTKNETVA